MLRTLILATVLATVTAGCASAPATPDQGARSARTEPNRSRAGILAEPSSASRGLDLVCTVTCGFLIDFSAPTSNDSESSMPAGANPLSESRDERTEHFELSSPPFPGDTWDFLFAPGKDEVLALTARGGTRTFARNAKNRPDEHEVWEVVGSKFIAEYNKLPLRKVRLELPDGAPPRAKCIREEWRRRRPVYRYNYVVEARDLAAGKTLVESHPRLVAEADRRPQVHVSVILELQQD